MTSLATSVDLGTRLKRQFSGAEADQADSYLEGASAYIRAVVDQEISEVVGDVITIDAPRSCTVWLPQRPVQSVASVTANGVLMTDWRLRGSRLIRRQPWMTCEPVELVITYTHGLPPGDDRLQFAKDACLTLAIQRMANPKGLTNRKIDDYAEGFGDGTVSTEHLDAALRRLYGKRPRTGSVTAES